MVDIERLFVAHYVRLFAEHAIESSARCVFSRSQANTAHQELP